MSKRKDILCINCGGKESRFLFNARDYRLETTSKSFPLYKCSGCGLMFVSPMPREDELGIFYPDDYYQSGISLFESLYAPLSDRCFKRMLREIKEFKSSGRSLDVGCGTGIFMIYFHREGFDAYGTDISKKAGSVLPDSLKSKVTIGPFLKNEFSSAYFDVIMLKQVLEHFTEPGAVLKEVYRILKPDGILYIEVPNTKCLEARLFKRYWYNLEVPRHLYHFNLHNFLLFVEKYGFKRARVLGSQGRMIFRTPLALVNSLLFYLRDKGPHRIDLMTKAVYYLSFFPLLFLTLLYRLLSAPEKQTDLRIIFKKEPQFLDE